MKKIFNIISTFIFIVLIALAGILFVPKAFNIQPTAVLSGSMEPTYPVGSLIFVDHNVSKDDIEVGKAITFKISDTTLVTHRVVEINDKGEYVTKGDANKSNDGDEVKFENVVGMPKFVIPYLGYIATYATTKSGMILLITIILVLILLTFIPDWISSDKKDKSKGGNLNEKK
ncbi:signal peptidase I [Thomasclavelia sp.]